MRHDVFVGAVYGLVVPFVMPFIAFWTRKVSYWVFFAFGGLSVPAFAFFSMGVRRDWVSATREVLPRIFTADGLLIVIGLGAGSVLLAWFARFSGFEYSQDETQEKNIPDSVIR